MAQIKAKNPQMANQIQGLINSNGNPIDIYHQIMKDKSPEQVEKFYQYAKQCGIPDNLLNQVQNNGINTE